MLRVALQSAADDGARGRCQTGGRSVRLRHGEHGGAQMEWAKGKGRDLNILPGEPNTVDQSKDH